MMITHDEFVAKWKAAQMADAVPEEFELVRADAGHLENIAIPQADKDFLAQSGLPKSAAPCLDFEEVASFPSLPSHYGLKGSFLKQYYVLGYDGAGNPFCIDEANSGRIVLLEHEDNFRTVQFVNSSVSQLAQTLLLFNPWPASRQVLQRIQEIDATAGQEGCFWWHEAQRADEEN